MHPGTLARRTALLAGAALPILMAGVSDTIAGGIPKGYSLVWAEEFDGSGLPSPRNWTYDTEANATGWYNNELQYYSAGRLSNSSVRSGLLSITARKERLTSAKDYGGQNYTSARLITRGKAAWTYGFFEIRAKLPCGQGTLPAIWMLPVTGSWPAAGEIDIMEMVNRDPTIYGTIHNSSTAGTAGAGGHISVSSACTQFHNYQLTWTAETISFGVDGKTYYTYANAHTGKAQWPFSRPMYLILNVAVGGNWPGNPVDRLLPVTMTVDYVRIYQKR